MGLANLPASLIDCHTHSHQTNITVKQQARALTNVGELHSQWPPQNWDLALDPSQGEIRRANLLSAIWDHWGPVPPHMCVKSFKSCPTVCDPMDCSLPGSSVHGIFQARILEWVAMPSSRDLPPLRDRTHPGLLPLLHWQVGSLPLAPPGKLVPW